MSQDAVRIVIFGATGHAGSGVLRACLDDPDVAAIHLVTRRPVDVEDDRIETHICTDFSDLGDAAAALEEVDAVFYALGISATKVDGEAEYRVITYDYAMEAARALKERSPDATMHFVSGAGTSETSRWMWARVKAETESALREAGLGGVVCWRPAFIHKGGVGGALFGWSRRMAVHRNALGQAMLQATRDALRDGTLENAAIRDLADRYTGAPKKRRIVAKVILTLLALIAITVTGVVIDGWTAFGQKPSGARLESLSQSKQWSSEQERFVNPQPLWNDWWGAIAEAMDTSDYGSPATELPVERIDPKRFDDAPESGMRVTWLGHSSMLIEIEGKRFLTDPLWSERISPLTWIGPRRWYAPPIALGDLPSLDAVIISHDHYDHLDHGTIVQLAHVDTTFVVPLGVGSHLTYWGVPNERIVELDWWETHPFGHVNVHATPARHASGRLSDGRQNQTLWAGYAFVGRNQRAFFSGDTGLFPGMEEIGERYGPFDVTMIEVGAYGQSWPDWHLGPEQAVRAHRMLRGKMMLPVHWGLVNLANHAWTEPIERVLVAAQARGVQVITPKPGESFEPASPRPTAKWWPEVPWRPAEDYPIVATLIAPE